MNRPSYDEAAGFWRALLHERGLPREIRWVFRENLCLEPAQADNQGFRIVFQTFSPKSSDELARRVYGAVSKEAQQLVFEALLWTDSFTLCTMLGDAFGTDDDIYRKDWDMYFCADEPYKHYREVLDSEKWRNLQRRESGQPSGLDYVFVVAKVLTDLKHK